MVKRLATIKMGLYASRLPGQAGARPLGSGTARARPAALSQKLVARHWLESMRRTAPRAQRGPAEQCPASPDGRPPGRGSALSCSPPSSPKRPALVRLLPDQHDPIDIWMVLHPDVQKTGRMRALVAALGGGVPAPAGLK